MNIQVRTDHNINASENYSNEIKEIISKKLRRFENYLTTIELHLTDTNGRKEGRVDKRCMIEVRPKGLRPLAVTNEGKTTSIAIHGAVEKMIRVLDTQFVGLSKRHPHTNIHAIFE